MSQTSEISEITSVRSVESGHESSGIPIAAVLAALGREALAAAQVGSKVAAGATRLAWRGAVKAVEAMRAANAGPQELRPWPASLRADVMRAGTLDGAISTLAGAGARLTDAGTVDPLLENAASALRLGRATEARETLAALVDEAAAQHQRLVADCVLTHAEAVMRERGFTQIRVIRERGYLLAERTNGEAMRLDVMGSRDGRGVRYVLDADGFTDDRCIEEAAAVHAGMKKHGVAGEVIRSVRKPRIPFGRTPSRLARAI